MPFENWDIVHYVIVNDVIVSHQFVIQSHPSLQSTLYIEKPLVSMHGVRKSSIEN